MTYYLKPTIKAEPLIWRWYAWSHLIFPATAACNIVDRHLKIMQSYIQNPQIHAQAVKDPKMLGGPFIDLEGKQIDEIKELIYQTNQKCEALINLNRAIKNTDRMIQSEAKGCSLEVFYQRIPTELKGMVEFVYDLNNNPSIRLIEDFIYKKYYKDNDQEIALSDSSNDFRKFVLSTPRLYNANEVYLKIPFSDKKLDFLFNCKNKSCDLKEIIELLEIPKNKQKLFKSFFTNNPPIKLNNNYNGTKVRMRYFGHACILIQTDSLSILFDPIISYNSENNLARYTFNDLPDQIDFVIITHNHQDHLMFETLLQLRHKIKHIVFPENQKGALVDPSIRLILKNIGFTSLIGLSELQTLDIVDGQIMGLPFLGEHSDLNIQSKLSYYINLKGKKLLVAADSNNLDDHIYDHLFDIIGSIDILFIGMECDGAPLTWLYGPLLSSQLNRTFDFERKLSGSNCNKVWSIVKKLKCIHVYIYAMGQEPWLNHIMALNCSLESLQIKESNKLVALCKENGIKSERLFGKKEWVI